MRVQSSPPSGFLGFLHYQDEAIGMLGIHGDLLISVSGQLVDPRLRHLGEFLERRGIADVLQAQSDPAAVVGPVVPDKLSFGV